MRSCPRPHNCLNTDCLSIHRSKHFTERFKVKFRITGKYLGNEYFFFFSEFLRGLVSKVQASRCAENFFKTKETVGGMHMPEIIAPVRETSPFFSRSSCWCICRQVVVRSVEQRNFREKAFMRGKRREVSSV